VVDEGHCLGSFSFSALIQLSDTVVTISSCPLNDLFPEVLFQSRQTRIAEVKRLALKMTPERVGQTDVPEAASL